MTKDIENLINKINEIENSISKGALPQEKDIYDLIDVAINKKSLEAEAHAKITLARLFFYKREFNQGINLFENFIPKIEKLKNARLTAKIYNVLGSLYDKVNNKELTLTCFLNALTIYREINDHVKEAHTLSNIGTYYGTTLQDPKKSEYYLLKSWKIIDGDKTTAKVWLIPFQLGTLYLKKNNLEKSKKYYATSFEIAKKDNNKTGMAYGYYAKSRHFAKNNQYAKALTFIDKTINMLQHSQISFAVDTYFQYKAEFLYKLGRESESIIILNKIIEESKRQNEQSQANLLLYQIYFEKQDFEKALIHYKKHIEAKNEILSIESQKHIETTEAKYQNKVKEKEKEILRLQKVEMEQKALRAQLNPHFFFNSLNSINKFIIDNDAENASNFLFKFSSLMRKTLENSEESFITIEDEVAYLKDYLSLEQLRFNNSFTFEIKVDEKIEDDFIKIPTMMLQPYLENCIKHGINGLENGLIRIAFKALGEDQISCIIEDNGKGRSESKSEHKSMGTSILKARIKVFNEENNLKFTSKIIDLKDNENKPIGTRVELIMLENLL